MEVDFERAQMLLSVVKDISTVAPGYTHLSSAAMAELKAMNDEIRDDAIAESQARVQAEAEAAAQAKTLQAADEDDPNEEVDDEADDEPTTERRL